MVGVGDTKVGAVDKVGLAAAAAAGILMDEGALGIWSTKAGARGPPAAVTGTEASRVEAGAEVLSEAAVLGARAVSVEGAMEAGAETVETGGEVAERVGQGGEAIPVKDSRPWDPSPSISAERNTRLVSVMLSTHVNKQEIRTDVGSAHLSLVGETEVSSPLKRVVVSLLPGWIESLYGGWSG